MKRSSLLLAVLVSASCLSVSAQDPNYTEGTVSQVTAIQVTSGHLDEYMTYVRSEWKPSQEALKKAGIITDYSVYSTTARTPNDPDLYLIVTYANMAALDKLDERSDPVTEKVTGNRVKSNKGVSDRNAYRKILGTETIRELKIK
jgi:L-rhamnose mutarotase